MKDCETIRMIEQIKVRNTMKQFTIEIFKYINNNYINNKYLSGNTYYMFNYTLQ